MRLYAGGNNSFCEVHEELRRVTPGANTLDSHDNEPFSGWTSFAETIEGLFENPEFILFRRGRYASILELRIFLNLLADHWQYSTNFPSHASQTNTYAFQGNYSGLLLLYSATSCHIAELRNS
jgi:hypothetical protein